LSRRSLRVFASLTAPSWRSRSWRAGNSGECDDCEVRVLASRLDHCKALGDFLRPALSSIVATLVFIFFFLSPVGTFTIADPQNWVALFSVLATSLIASRLSAKAKVRAFEAIERQQDVERLYSFSRAILMIDRSDPFRRQLAEKPFEIFRLDAVVLLGRRTDELYRVGGTVDDDLENGVRAATLKGGAFAETKQDCVVVPILHGAEPVASLGLHGPNMPESLLQGIANLVAIGFGACSSSRPCATDLRDRCRGFRTSAYPDHNRRRYGIVWLRAQDIRVLKLVSGPFGDASATTDGVPHVSSRRQREIEERSSADLAGDSDFSAV